MTERDLHQDDMILSAYLDGELPLGEADALTARLASEPALVERLAALRASDEAARQAFASLDEMPLPQGVLDMLQDRKADAGKAEPGSNISPFRSRAAQAFLQYPVAIAASLALALGFILSLQLTRNGGEIDSVARYQGTVQPGSELFRLLETGLGTQPVVMKSGAVGRLQLTFQDNAGGYCRQFQVDADQRSMQAVACRQDGQWALQVSAFAAPVKAPSPKAYQPATGPASAVMDAAVDGLIGDQPPLDAEAETKLVNSNWTSH